MESPTSATLVPSVPEPGRPPEDPFSAQGSLYLAYSRWRTGTAKATLGPRTNSLRAEAARRRRGRAASPTPAGAAGLAPTGRVACGSRSQPRAPGLTQTLFKVQPSPHLGPLRGGEERQSSRSFELPSLPGTGKAVRVQEGP